MRTLVLSFCLVLLAFALPPVSYAGGKKKVPPKEPTVEELLTGLNSELRLLSYYRSKADPPYYEDCAGEYYDQVEVDTATKTLTVYAKGSCPTSFSADYERVKTEVNLYYGSPVSLLVLACYSEKACFTRKITYRFGSYLYKRDPFSVKEAEVLFAFGAEEDSLRLLDTLAKILAALAK